MATSAAVEVPRHDVEMQDQQGRVSPSHEKKGASHVFTAEKDGNDTDSTDEIKQDGVRQVEAVTQVWTRTAMWSVFAM